MKHTTSNRKFILYVIVLTGALIFAIDYFEIDIFSRNEYDNEVTWSIIIAARNDEYGLTFKRRLQAFLNSVGYYDKKYKWKSEVLICQWNPIEEKPLIETAARRARGKWLLFINPDDILNKELASRLGDFTLWDEKCYYRADKLDFTHPLTSNIHPSKYPKYCRETATVLVGNSKLANNEEFWKDWENEAKQRQEEKSVEVTWPYTNADDYFTSSSGDFLAITAQKFKELKGHPEEGKYGTMDSVIMWIAGIAGHMCQARLYSPFVNCHQSHDRGNNTILPKSSFQKYKALTEQGINPQFNNDDWGLINERLYESSYEFGVWKKKESIVYLK